MAGDTSARLLAGKAVLLCEDEGLVVMHVNRALRECKCKVITAKTAAEAIEAARQHRPEVVLMDITLPDESGIEAARRILIEDSAYEPCLVFLTGLSDEEAHAAVVELDACGYLTKPFEGERLIGAVEQAWRTWCERKGRPVR